MPNPFRRLPAVNDVLATAPLAELAERLGRERAVEAVREELDSVRELLKDNHPIDADTASIALRSAHRLTASDKPLLRTVINATGIVLHTNLGRAPMAAVAANAAHDAASRYLNLEMSLETGERSSRQDPVRELLRRLTGAESATAVNNCAAATVIVLRALAAGREVVVSRGQLIEIGGSFRIPEIMAVSGATLREVGTTNITRIADYERGAGPNTAMLMRIHTSNYRVSGFTHAASLEELVALGRRLSLPVVDDVGSGALFDYTRLGLHGEPLVRESVTAGADLILFSGDKLLGGPQAGIIVGRASLVERIERDPLMRAFRLDKMTLAALEATLRLYLDESRAIAEVPVLAMLHQSLDDLRQRADSFVARLCDLSHLKIDVSESTAFVGGGSLPEQAMPTIVVAIRTEAMSDEQLVTRLRVGSPAVLARVQGGRVLLDLRTVFHDQEGHLADAIRRAATS